MLNILSVCNIIKPNVFIPFASQVIFKEMIATVKTNGIYRFRMYEHKTKLLRHIHCKFINKKNSFVDEKNITPSKNSIIIAKNKEKEEKKEVIGNEINKLKN